MFLPIEFLQRFFDSLDWTRVMAVAVGVGAVAATWDRLMSLIDQWILKIVPTKHRGYLLVLGNVIRYPIFRRTDEGRLEFVEWRLLRLPPGTYPQLIFVVQVREFSFQERPLVISPQNITNNDSHKVYKTEGNATVHFAKDGRNSYVSQVDVSGPDGIAHMNIQAVIATIVQNGSDELVNNSDLLNEAVLERCGDITTLCGIVIDSIRLSTTVAGDAQQGKDGMIEIARSLSHE